MESQTRSELREDGKTFAELLEQSFQQRDAVKEAEVVRGHVLEITKDSVIVDIGYKSEASVPLHEFTLVEGGPGVKVGDVIDVFVENREDDAGLVIVSKEKADKQRVWKDIEAIAKNQGLVDGVIVARVKGGLSVDIGVKAF